MFGRSDAKHDLAKTLINSRFLKVAANSFTPPLQNEQYFRHGDLLESEEGCSKYVSRET
jgi:hypothetical protein